jgi:hypothetical protein
VQGGQEVRDYGHGVCVRRFGALPPLPDGYYVAYVEAVEHYMAFGPGDWEGDISCDPYWCRRQALHRARKEVAA